jgi:UDP:flavonoid glycosyltransferase YjiC (YdhE family)
MRVLASVLPGTGHLLPLVPTLHALRDADHTVVVASAEPLRGEVAAAELDFAPVGPPWHESDADAFLPGFQAAGSVGQLRMFAQLAPTILPDLLTLAGNLRPHLLVREPYEFAAWLAAERSRVSMVVHAIGSFRGRRCCLPPSPGSRSPPPVRPLACPPTRNSGPCTAVG